MKAYVIKNKEGKYFTNTYVWANEVCNAYIDDSKENVEKIIKDCNMLLKDCEPVEITIAEGDLEQEIEEWKLEAIRWEEHFNNAKLDYKILEKENAVLKKALELGAKKIEFMAQMLGQTLDYNVEENLLELAKENVK